MAAATWMASSARRFRLGESADGDQKLTIERQQPTASSDSRARVSMRSRGSAGSVATAGRMACGTTVSTSFAADEVGAADVGV
jgi:hypothetical protein